MIASRAFVMIGFLAWGLAAQFPDQETLEADYAQFREEKQKSAAREDLLHEMFYRHTLGLPVDVSQLFGMTKAEAAIPRANAEEEVRRIRKSVRTLIKEYESLKLRVKTSQVQFAKPKNPEPGVVPPTRAPVMPKSPRLVGPRRIGHVGSPRRKPVRRQPTTRPSGQIALIKGSSDHSRVGHVLFRAGKYEQAIGELEAITGHRRVDIIDLFHLALSYERLARAKGERRLFAKANDLYSKIEARDSRENTAGKLVMGRWGKAARTARQTMLWLLDKGEWKPVLNVNKIQWEKAGPEESR